MKQQDLALVLSGGGARAAYQVGALSGIAERAGGDVRFPIMTGVSAGTINAAFLAGHRGTLGDAARLLERAWLRMSVGKVFNSSVASILGSAAKWLWMLATGGRTPGFEVRGILDTAPLREMLSRVVSPNGIDANLASGKLRALGLSATSYSTGRTVTFVQAANDVPIWQRVGRMSVRSRLSMDQVLASCALPLVFPAVAVGDEYFGDGSLRQTTPLAPAIHLGAGRLLAISVRYRRGFREFAERQVAGYPPPAQILGLLFNAVFADALEADAERVERINRTLALVPPGRPHPDGLRPLSLVVLRPSRDIGKLASDLGGHLPQALRVLIRGLGSADLKSPDLLSYLLFERPYIERLLELGRADALAQWDRIEPLLEPETAARVG